MNDSSAYRFSIRESFETQFATNAKIVALLNVTDLMYQDVDLREVVLKFKNVSMESFLESVAQSLPYYKLET